MTNLIYLFTLAIFLPIHNYGLCKTVPASSSVTSDVNGTNSNNLNSSEGNCSNYIEERKYILLENGSVLLPSSDNIYSYETYFIQNDTAFICVDESMIVTESTKPAYNLSHEFINCGHILIDPDEYKLLKNGSVYIELYSNVYGPRDYYLTEKGVYVCVPSFSDMTSKISHPDALLLQLNKFSMSFIYVSYLGLMLSIISLVSHLAVFCVVSSVRNLPGCCLASLSLSLLMAYLCYLAVAISKTSYNCANLGISIYYFFLTSFFWMNTIAFDVWRSFRVVMKELRISSHRVPWRRFLLYSIYSWMVPAALTAFVTLVDSSDLLPEEFKPGFGKPVCWFSARKSLMVFFAVPLCIVMLLNGIFFLDVAFLISRATLKTSHTQEATLKKRFFMFMRLALIMGLTWVVGFVAAFFEYGFLWYLFIILNTLQGLFIFIVFSCSSKVRALCMKKFRNLSKTKTSTSVRTISSAI